MLQKFMQVFIFETSHQFIRSVFWKIFQRFFHKIIRAFLYFIFTITPRVPVKKSSKHFVENLFSLFQEQRFPQKFLHDFLQTSFRVSFKSSSWDFSRVFSKKVFQVFHYYTLDILWKSYTDFFRNSFSDSSTKSKCQNFFLLLKIPSFS